MVSTELLINTHYNYYIIILLLNVQLYIKIRQAGQLGTS